LVQGAVRGMEILRMLFSARNIQERSQMKEQLAASLDRVDTPADIWDRAAEIQEALTEQAQHRSASIPDLIVAAAARAGGLEILHYDRDWGCCGTVKVLKPWYLRDIPPVRVQTVPASCLPAGCGS
jgi:predicted nucleic acid-binding protein